MLQRLSDLELRVHRVCEGQHVPVWFSPELSFEFPCLVRAGLVSAIAPRRVLVRLWRSPAPSPNEPAIGQITFSNTGSEDRPSIETFFSTEPLKLNPFTSEREKSEDVEVLLAVLESGLGRPSGQDPTIAAIRRLGELRCEEAIPFLRRALDHKNVTVKTDAALALAEMGEDDGAKALARFLGEERSMVAAARNLARIGNDESIELLLHFRSSEGERMFNGRMTPISEIVGTLLQEADPVRFPAPRASKKERVDCMLLAGVPAVAFWWY